MWKLVVDETDATFDIITFYVSAISSFIGMILSIIFLLITGYNFIVVFWLKKKQNTEDVLSYEMLLLLQTTTFFSCLSYSMLRSNIITNIDVDQFTLFQCTFGFLMTVFFYLISRTLFYIILIHRIKFSFKDTLYRYNEKIYRFYYLTVILLYLYAVCMRLYAAFKVDYIAIYYNTKHNIAYCTPGNHGNVQFFPLARVSGFLIGFIEFILGLGLLFLFAKRLYLIRNVLVRQYLKTDSNSSKQTKKMTTVQLKIKDLFQENDDEINMTMNMSVDDKTDDTKEDEEKGIDSNDNKLDDTDNVFNVETESSSDVLNKYKYKEMINKSHDMIKKQTILLFIGIVSSLLYSMGMVIHPYMIRVVAFSLTLNMICLCLMFSQFDIYWICCTKYGFCACCYVQKSK